MPTPAPVYNKTPVYGIFEGGGAKAIAHIAGVHAAEWNNLEFIGVAGASAGALIASLVAVGYEADDLFNPRIPTSILSITGSSALSIIGGEQKWKLFDDGIKQKDKAIKAACSMFGGGIWARIRAPLAVKIVQEVYRDGGYFSTEQIREHLNILIRDKLLAHHAKAVRKISVPDRVTFNDINPARVPECCSLKVIVTDITNQKLIIFDNSDKFKHVEVAEVVAASISIPFIFKPAKILSYKEQPNAIYADGGLASNLPIWVFEEEKLNYERKSMQNSRVTILGFTLEQPTTSTSDSLEFFNNYAQCVTKSAIFAGQAVASQFVPDLLMVKMPCSLETTQFDLSIQDARNAYQLAHNKALEILGDHIHVKPNLVHNILYEFHNDIINNINSIYHELNIDHLRISIIQPFGDSSFRVIHSFNMESDADDRLVFSNLLDGSPNAYGSRSPAYLDFGAMLSTKHAPANMTKYEFAQLRKSLHSAICFPIFDNINAWGQHSTLRPEPLGVVSIDSDFSLLHIFHDATLLKDIAILTDILKVILQPPTALTATTSSSPP